MATTLGRCDSSHGTIILNSQLATHTVSASLTWRILTPSSHSFTSTSRTTSSTPTSRTCHHNCNPLLLHPVGPSNTIAPTVSSLLLLVLSFSSEAAACLSRDDLLASPPSTDATLHLCLPLLLLTQICANADLWDQPWNSDLSSKPELQRYTIDLNDYGHTIGLLALAHIDVLDINHVVCNLCNPTTCISSFMHLPSTRILACTFTSPQPLGPTI